MNARSQAGAFYNVRPIIGRDLEEVMRILWPEPVAAEVMAAFRHTLETGEAYRSRNFTSQRADTDNVESYEWELHRITLPDGKLGVVSYYFDTTRLRKAEQALREADRRKDEFLATLAHELRNPLAPIRNGLQILRSAGADPAAAAQVHEMLERQVNHLVRLVDDLMEVARVTRGRIELRREPVDLGAMLRSAVETSRPLIEAARHELTVSVPARARHRDGRSGAACADHRESAEQRGEVHGGRRPHLAHRRAAKATMPSCRCATAASAFPSTCCRAFSTCSRKRTARITARRAGSASASRSCAPWSSCTAAPSTAKSEGLGPRQRVHRAAAARRRAAERRDRPRGERGPRLRVAPHSRRRRQPRCGREPRVVARESRGRRAYGQRRAGCARRARSLSAVGHAARHRHARHGWPRGRAAGATAAPTAAT